MQGNYCHFSYAMSMNFWEKVDNELKYLGKSRKELASFVGIDVANIKSLKSNISVKTASGIKYICNPQRCKDKSWLKLASPQTESQILWEISRIGTKIAENFIIKF